MTIAPSSSRTSRMNALFQRSSTCARCCQNDTRYESKSYPGLALTTIFRSYPALFSRLAQPSLCLDFLCPLTIHTHLTTFISSLPSHHAMQKSSQDPKSTVWNEGSVDELLLDPDHDCYYFVDTSIVVAYHSQEFPFLNRYIDTMSLKGPRFFVTSRIAAGFTTAPLPAPFKIFRDKEASIRVDFAYPTVVAWFNLGTPSAQFKVDICWLLESWYCLCSCYDIPPEDIVSGRAFALTMNAELVGRFIEDPASNRRLERIIDERALEHLASVRHLARDGTFRDLLPLLPL
jgi:hypothetical protein